VVKADHFSSKEKPGSILMPISFHFLFQQVGLALYLCHLVVTFYFQKVGLTFFNGNQWLIAFGLSTLP
jgi:hypothetical protein